MPLLSTARLTFLASAKDAAGTTVYGVGHQAGFFAGGGAGQLDIDRLRSEGKIDLISPDIRNIRVVSVGTTTAQIGWTVDQPCCGMEARYGVTNNPATIQAATPAAGTGNIVANLTGLTTGTLYYYIVVAYIGTSVVANYATVTSNYTFTTL